MRSVGRVRSQIERESDTSALCYARGFNPGRLRTDCRSPRQTVIVDQVNTEVITGVYLRHGKMAATNTRTLHRVHQRSGSNLARRGGMGRNRVGEGGLGRER